MGYSERQSRERCAFHISNWDLLPTAVAEASNQQAFVDVLENNVIKPLRTLKVNISFVGASLF